MRFCWLLEACVLPLHDDDVVMFQNEIIGWRAVYSVLYLYAYIINIPAAVLGGNRIVETTLPYFWLVSTLKCFRGVSFISMTW